MTQHWTEEDLQKVKARWAKGGVDGHANASATVYHGKVRGGVKRTTPTVQPESSPAPSPYRSKLEAAWAQKLNLDKRANVITDWQYEPLNLRLPGKRNFYKPDFLTMTEGPDESRTLIFYEVKGWNKSDDRSLVKMKTAAGITPWARFILVKRVHGQWEERVIV